MNKKKKIYISLPITGYTLHTRRERCLMLAEALHSLGWEVYHPFMIHKPADVPEEKAYAYYMGEDIKMILNCDAVYFDNDWKDSKGCMLEYHAAQIYGLETFYLFSEIYEIKS